jgi:hypothetical protein
MKDYKEEYYKQSILWDHSFLEISEEKERIEEIIKVIPKKVYRHMKELHMLQPKKIKKKKKTCLVIDCPITSNSRWEGDLTYLWDGHQINYLLVIVDGYDKEPPLETVTVYVIGQMRPFTAWKKQS